MDCLPAANFSTLVRDGPSVNKTIFNRLQSLIKAENAQFSSLVDLGSCILYNVHNSFGRDLDKFGKDIDQLCLDLHFLLKYSAARRLSRAAVGTRCGRSHISAAHRSEVVKSGASSKACSRAVGFYLIFCERSWQGCQYREWQQYSVIKKRKEQKGNWSSSAT